MRRTIVYVIGIDPHKGSHTAAVLDVGEQLVGELRVVADRGQRDRLLRFAEPFTPRTWAIEAAGGLGALLAQQLVAVGETVLDVPPTLSARVRLLDSGCTDKTDPHDARAAEAGSSDKPLPDPTNDPTPDNNGPLRRALETPLDTNRLRSLGARSARRGNRTDQHGEVVPTAG
jgi:transposase